MTTIGWSFCGNIFGVGAAAYVDKSRATWKTMRQIKKLESTKAFAFLGTVAAFTIYGYGCGKQNFINQKLEIVKNHSIGFSEK